MTFAQFFGNKNVLQIGLTSNLVTLSIYTLQKF